MKKSEILFAALRAHSDIEDELQELFDGPSDSWSAKKYSLTFSHIGYDDYDGSIELYVRADAVFDQSALIVILRDFGFTFGWINFDDGTEIHFSKDYFGAREKKEHPHWTKEMSVTLERGTLDHFLSLYRPALRRLLAMKASPVAAVPYEGDLTA